MNPREEDIYLDSNFLIAYFVTAHNSHKKAVKLMAQLLSTNNTLCYSPLSLDETFNIIYEELKRNAPPSSQGYNHADFFVELNSALSVLLQHKQMKLKQFENNLYQGAINALNNVKNYTMRPRDSFHTAYMQDLQIKYIVSEDSGFDKLSKINISRVSY